MKKVNGQFIKLYNVFREEGSQYHLSVDELYLYSVLRRLVNFKDETIVNVDVIEQFSNVFFNSRPTINKKVIKETLLSLKEKSVIHYDGEPSKNTQLLKITFNYEFDNDGHEQINYDNFDKVTDKTMFYIYFVVASWKKVKGGFIASYGRWADILDVSKETAQKYVNMAVEEGIIYVNTGDYSDELARDGQKKQSSNTYSIYPFKEEDKTPAQKEKEASTSKLHIDIQSENSDYPFDTGNWKSRNNNLTVDDYVLYLKHKGKTDHISKDFVADCEKKINKIKSKNDKFKFIDKKLMKQAQEKLERRERERSELFINKAREIINETDDVVVLVNGHLTPYAEWNQEDKVDKVYYQFGKWVSQVDNFVYETYSRDIIDNDNVEFYRPDENGEWDDEEKENQREMKLYQETDEWY